MTELENRYQEKLEELKIQLIDKHNQTLNSDEEAIQRRYDENEKNLKKLEQIKSLYQETLSKLEVLDND